MVYWRRRSPASSTPSQARRLPEGERLYAIGDVHGCHHQLASLLRHIEADNAAKPEADVTLVFLGDYVDRGPGSARVLKLLQAPRAWVERTIALKGNHEEMLLNFLSDAGYAGQWRHFGGLDTLASFAIDIKEVRKGYGYDTARAALAEAIAPEMPFLDSLATHYSAGDYFFCHAGIRPGIALDAQSPRDLMWIRHEFLASGDDHGMFIVHGHSPVERPDVRPNRVNVDTGAYATGRLTAVVLEADTMGFLTVDATGGRASNE